MLYMAKLGTDVITEEINLDEEETASEGGGCTSVDCQQKLKGRTEHQT